MKIGITDFRVPNQGRIEGVRDQEGLFFSVRDVYPIKSVNMMAVKRH